MFCSDYISTRHTSANILTSRKKCDESRPKCGLCVKRDLQCSWPSRVNEIKNKRKAPSFKIVIQKPDKWKSQNLTVQEETMNSSRDSFIKKRSNSNPLDAGVSHITDSGDELAPSSRFDKRPTTSPFYGAINNDLNSPLSSTLRSEGASIEHPLRLYDLIDRLYHTSTEDHVIINTPQASETTLKYFDNIDNFLSLEDTHPNTGTVVTSGSDFSFFYPLYESLGDPFPAVLTLAEKSYFICYCTCVAPAMSVTSLEKNSFLNVLVPMALKEEAILYGIIAWGCIFMGNRLNEKSLYSEASRLIKKSIRQAHIKSVKEDKNFLAILSCYIILTGIEISIGDTDIWYKYLLNCYYIIENMGGIVALKDYSVEGKFLAENFVYYDILASQSNENGTYYAVSQYYDIFYKNFGFIESLQGCIWPLILILGDIINLVVEAKEIFGDSFVCEQNVEDANEILLAATNLEIQVKNARPLMSQDMVFSEKDDIENHLMIFELYQLTIELYIRQAVRRYPPVIPENQVILYKIIERLDILIETSVKSLLSFPILIAGLNSVSRLDKQKIRYYIEKLVMEYEFNNILKVRMILEEVWKLNLDGSLCMNWFQVTKSFVGD